MFQEIFVIERNESLSEDDQSYAEHLHEKKNHAQALGLKAQAQLLDSDIVTVERGGLIATEPLTEDELCIWQAWLPTRYVERKDRHWSERPLKNYVFDRIPHSVLELWQKHKEAGTFQTFEIWAPEIEQPDPILIGRNGNVRHLLARWGESDANLVSFDDIKRILTERTTTSIVNREGFGWAVLMAAAIIILCMAISFFGGHPAEEAARATFRSTPVISIITFFVAGYFCAKTQDRQNPVLQAIARNPPARETIAC